MREFFGCWSLSLAGWLCALSCGCAGPAITSGKIVSSPLSVEQQQEAVLEVAPLQTPRTEVERRLRAAGIQITPGLSPSICYCDVWNRKDGSRWRIDVALLFDRNDQLYATRQASAETNQGATDASSESPSHAGSRTARGSRSENLASGEDKAIPAGRGPVVGSPFGRESR